MPIHQSLFGYSDGHRLISSSRKLEPAELSQLLPLSDLGSGVVFKGGDSYYTGVPLTETKTYALMKTWKAHEITRPGAVWTHALLIDFADLGALSDLEPLIKLFRRPSKDFDSFDYIQPILANTDDTTKPLFQESNRSTVLSLIRAIYKSNSPTVGEQQGIEAAIFQVWSQQWPKLRRRFSFRTAGFADPRRNGQRFNIQISDSMALSFLEKDNSEEAVWESTVLDDLEKGDRQGDLRKFLWRYGPDLSNGFTKFADLVKIYNMISKNNGSVSSYQDLIKTTFHIFPKVGEAALLKKEMLASDLNAYSFFEITDPVRTAWGTLVGPDSEEMDALYPVLADRLIDIWPSRKSEVYQVLTTAENERPKLARAILEKLSRSFSLSELQTLTEDAELLIRLVSLNPTILDDPTVVDVDPKLIIRLLSELDLSKELLANIVERILLIDSDRLANHVIENFPDVTFGKAVFAVTQPLKPIKKSWFKIFSENPKYIFDHDLIASSATFSDLHSWAELLNWDSTFVLSKGPEQWAKAVQRLSPGETSEVTLRFKSFLLVLALKADPKAAGHCETLFEFSFDSVHEGYAREAFWRYDSVLEKYLPYLVWEQWDRCKRLRIAVVDHYIKCKLSPESFIRLTDDSYVLSRLVDQIPSSRSGKAFKKQVASLLKD